MGVVTYTDMFSPKFEIKISETSINIRNEYYWASCSYSLVSDIVFIREITGTAIDKDYLLCCFAFIFIKPKIVCVVDAMLSKAFDYCSSLIVSGNYITERREYFSYRCATYIPTINEGNIYRELEYFSNGSLLKNINHFTKQMELLICAVYGVTKESIEFHKSKVCVRRHTNELIEISNTIPLRFRPQNREEYNKLCLYYTIGSYYED